METLSYYQLMQRCGELEAQLADMVAENINMSNEKQFEQWCQSVMTDDADFCMEYGMYINYSVRLYWQAWQAATHVASSQLTALTSQLESVVAENAALKAICEDRRQFILNGVEMGFIRLPDKDIKDPAKATYERCLSGMQAAPCQKCNDTGMTDSGGTQPWGEPIEIECDCGAYQLRQGGAV